MSTPEVLTNGFYRWVQNAMRMGTALLRSAIGFGLENGWIILFKPTVLMIISSIAFRHEKICLVGKFGGNFRKYKGAVGRF